MERITEYQERELRLLLEPVRDGFAHLTPERLTPRC
jgi:hypothetical protein